MRTTKDKFGIVTFAILFLASVASLIGEIAYIPMTMIKLPENVVGFEVPMFIFETLGIVVGIYLCFLALKALYKHNDHKQAISLLIYTFIAIGVTSLVVAIIGVAEIVALQRALTVLDILPVVLYAIGAVICLFAIFVKQDNNPMAKYIFTIIGLFSICLGELFDLIVHFATSVPVSVGICLIIAGAVFAIIYCFINLKEIKVHKEEKHE